MISKSNGIIFIYTEFIPSGVLPLSFALEHLGFEKYSGNILDYPEWKKDSILVQQKESQLIMNGIQFHQNLKVHLKEQNTLF